MHTKFQKLYTGKRPFSKRLGIVFLPALAISFTLAFYGPLDFIHANQNFFPYSAQNIASVTALITCVLFLVLLAAAAIPGGKIHAFLISAYTGINAAFFLQKTYLNPDFRLSDEHTINWSSFSTMMLKNLFIWIIILLLPHILHYFNNRLWRYFSILLSAVLLLVQGQQLFVELSGPELTGKERTPVRYLSDENILKPGKTDNIVVFLLNETSSSDIRSMSEKYPEALSPFHDFTYYDNANSHYMYTVPSLADLLTGEEWDCGSEHIQDYLNNAWNSDKAASFYRKLADKGYERNFYFHLPYAADDLSVLQNIISNLKQADQDYEIDHDALQNLLKLSLYRICPLMLKPFFMLSLSDISNMITWKDAMNSEWDFVSAMNEGKLTNGDFENAFLFYFLKGSQIPYIMDQDGHLKTDSDPEEKPGKEEQLAGFFRLIADYMEQLKNMGIYNSTGIIILSDHGNNSEKSADHQPIYLTKFPEEQHEAMTFSSAPITIQDCFLPDVMEMAGENSSQWGISSKSVSDETAERWTRTYAKDSDYQSIDGAAYNVMREYRYEGDSGCLTEMWIAGDFSVIPITDSFY